jgi:hypothetical protein
VLGAIKPLSVGRVHGGDELGEGSRTICHGTTAAGPGTTGRTWICSPLKHLRQIGADQVAAVMYPRIPPGTVGVLLFFPFHQAALAAVFLDQPGHAVMPPTPALGAFDAEHFELAFDVAEDEIGTGHVAEHRFYRLFFFPVPNDTTPALPHTFRGRW